MNSESPPPDDNPKPPGEPGTYSQEIQHAQISARVPEKVSSAHSLRNGWNVDVRKVPSAPAPFHSGNSPMWNDSGMPLSSIASHNDARPELL